MTKTAAFAEALAADPLDRDMPIPTGWAEAQAHLNAMTAAGVPDEVAEMVADLEREFAHVSDQIDRAAVSLIDTLEGTRRYIADGFSVNGFSVNGLGELQGRAPQFDCLCARRQQLAESIRAARYFAARSVKAES